MSYLATLFRHHRAVSLAAMALLRSRRSRTETLDALRWLVVTLDNFRYASTLDSGHVAVIDEGIVQRCFLLFVDRSGSAPWATTRQFLQHSPSSHVIVTVDVPPDVAVHRVGGRERGLPARFEGLDAQRLESLLAEARSMLQDCVVDRAHQAGCRSLEIEGLGEEAGEAIIAALVDLRPPPA
jgi:hypothetical protein